MSYKAIFFFEDEEYFPFILYLWYNTILKNEVKA